MVGNLTESGQLLNWHTLRDWRADRARVKVEPILGGDKV
jgi:hypothetical protein